jgi:hypothetical protein
MFSTRIVLDFHVPWQVLSFVDGTLRRPQRSSLVERKAAVLTGYRVDLLHKDSHTASSKSGNRYGGVGRLLPKLAHRQSR